jgi:hypothetical protein
MSNENYVVRDFTVQNKDGNTIAENVAVSASADNVYFTVGGAGGDTEITLREIVFGDNIPSSNAKNLHGRITTLEKKKIDITSIPSEDIENKIKKGTDNDNTFDNAVLTYKGFKAMRNLEANNCTINGEYSYAIGSQTKAMGSTSFAYGNNTTAEGKASFAGG